MCYQMPLTQFPDALMFSGSGNERTKVRYKACTWAGIFIVHDQLEVVCSLAKPQRLWFENIPLTKKPARSCQRERDLFPHHHSVDDHFVLG